jgi:TetR/AcrR family transcriptional regulator, transcriptional repressor for nem operon
MARPKEFDRETALEEAIEAFSDSGYEGTSTDALLRAMRISRQSLYDTFGDKRRLYLGALQRYIADSVAAQIRTLNSVSSPLQGLEATLNAMASTAARSCLGVSAICEFGRSDRDVAMLTDTAGRTLLSALERRIAEAKAAGEISLDVDVRAAAQFVAATFSGIKVAGRGGASPETRRDIARMALRSLK